MKSINVEQHLKTSKFVVQKCGNNYVVMMKAIVFRICGKMTMTFNMLVNKTRMKSKQSCCFIINVNNSDFRSNPGLIFLFWYAFPRLFLTFINLDYRGWWMWIMISGCYSIITVMVITFSTCFIVDNRLHVLEWFLTSLFLEILVFQFLRFGVFASVYDY